MKLDGTKESNNVEIQKKETTAYGEATILRNISSGKALSIDPVTLNNECRGALRNEFIKANDPDGKKQSALSVELSPVEPGCHEKLQAFKDDAKSAGLSMNFDFDYSKKPGEAIGTLNINFRATQNNF